MDEAPPVKREARGVKRPHIREPRVAVMKDAPAPRNSSRARNLCMYALGAITLSACHTRSSTLPDAGSVRAQEIDAAHPHDARTPELHDASAESDSGDVPGASTIELSVGQLTFTARATGPEDGELVLLLHGFPQTSYQWRYALEALAGAGYRAVAPDQRGYSPGARPESDDAYAARALVIDVLGMADALGADRFHVVGHDWGALIAWVLAAAVGDRILSVTAVSTAHPDLVAAQRAMPESCQTQATSHFAERKLPDAASMLLADDARMLRALYGDLPETAIAEYLRVLGNEPALDAALAWFRVNIDPRDRPAPVGPVTVPALYVFSDEDPNNCLITAELNESFATGPYRLAVLEGVDHWVVERAPEAFNALLIEHIRAHPAEPSDSDAGL